MRRKSGSGWSVCGATTAHALEGWHGFQGPAQTGPSQHPPAQDGVAGIHTRGFLRERRVTASVAGFQVTERVWAGNADVPPAPQALSLLSVFRPRGAGSGRPQGEGRREPKLAMLWAPLVTWFSPQPRVAPREIRLSPGGCDGRCGGQAGRAAVHQRGRCAGQRRRPGLLPDLGVGFVGGHCRHPRPHRPLRLHLLPARLHLALPAFNS